MKSKLENSKHLNQEDEKTVTKRTTKVVDRVRKVKSLLLESTQKEMKLEKEKEIQVIKGKAKKIKGFFETAKNEDRNDSVVKPKKPKRKFIKPVAETSKQEDKITSYKLWR